MPRLYIISGCNGAGKTTASYTILPEILKCKEFVNADEIAKGLSPFQPEKVAIEAGRIMLNRINDLLHNNENFAFETTLASRTYIKLIQKAQAKDYSVTLLYFWLNSVDLAVERVKYKVMKLNEHSNIIEGLKLAYNRLLEQRQKEDGELIFSHEGKITKVKARKLKKLEINLPVN